ncbi:hypothetical protein EON78_07030 [bacterium]|nr:MAG: hypothetical protein EON78_07030 [bacterium]
MACSIDYLRNTYSGEKLKTLANHHYQIKDELANSKLFRKDPQGKLHFFKDKLVDQAINKIGSINQRYANYIPNGTKIVHMDNNGLKININPIAEYILAENDAASKYEEEKFFQNQNQLEELFYYEGTKEAGSTAEPDDVKETSEATTKYFDKVLQDLRERITAVRQTLNEKPYAKGYRETLKDLEEVIKHEDELRSIMEYITKSASHLRGAKKQFDYIKDKYKHQNHEATYDMILGNYRHGKIGRITLDDVNMSS